MNVSGTQEDIVIRTILETTAELTSIAAFGTMITVWALILV